MFKKKKNSKKDTSVQKKKKKDSMATVLDESVTDRVMEDFEENKRFTASKNGDPVYVGILLNTEDIGGLNKKSKKDEDKGSIIQQISSNRINAYIPKELMEDEKIVFIPNPETLSTMDEYGLLIEAPYHIALVSPDGTVEDTEEEVSFEDIKKFAENVGTISQDQTLTQFLADLGVELDEDDDEAINMEDDTDEYDGEIISDDDDDDIPPFVPTHTQPEPNPIDFTAMTDDESGMAEYDSDPYLPEDPSQLDELNYPMQEPQETDSIDFTAADIAAQSGDIEYDDLEEIAPETVAKTMSIVYDKDDLNIEVDESEFEQFITEPTSFPMLETSWMNDQINTIISQANAALDMFHNDKMQQLRTYFHQMLAYQFEFVQQQLDTDNPDSEAYQLAQEINRIYDLEKDELDNKTAEKRRQIRENWDTRLKEVGEAAKVKAIEDYRERHLPEYDDRIDRVETDLYNQLLAEKQRNIRDLNYWRRKKAADMMHYGQIEILKKITDMHQQNMKEERDLATNWSNAMQSYLNDWRAEEISVKNAREAEQRINMQVSDIQKELDRRIDMAAKEKEKLIAEHQQEIERLKITYQEQMAAADNTWENRLKSQQEKEAQAKGRFQEAQDSYNDLKQRNEDLKKRNDDLEARLEKKDDRATKEMNKAQKKAEKKAQAQVRTTMLIMGALAVGLLIAGLFLGMFMQQRTNTSYERQMQEIDRQFQTGQNSTSND